MIYAIYCEGYRATGGGSSAQMIASGIEASTFKEACIIFSKTEEAKGYGNFCEKGLSFWGCSLFDNMADAQKSFG